MIDVALSCGGTEAVVESYYSVMGTQRQDGGQSNDTLALRTKLDWCLPNIMQCVPLCREAILVYMDGLPHQGISRHLVGNAGRALSKVLNRHLNEEPKFSCLT